MFHHPPLHFQTFLFEKLYLFVVEEATHAYFFGKLKPLFKFEFEVFEERVGKVECAPDVDAFVNHAKEGRRKFDEVEHVLVIHIFVNAADEVSSPPLDAADVSSILDYCYNFGEE
jgi:hypothetical protein